MIMYSIDSLINLHTTITIVLYNTFEGHTSFRNLINDISNEDKNIGHDFGAQVDEVW